MNRVPKDPEAGAMSGTIRYALILLVLLVGVFAPGRAAAQTDFSGMYLAKGVNADGSEYRGIVRIIPHGESFMVSWTSLRMAGDVLVLKRVWVGLGIPSDGVLAVCYSSADAAGVVVYRYDDDGKRLAARWVVAGEDGRVHSETLVKLPDVGTDEPDADEPPEGEEPAPRVDPTIGTSRIRTLAS
jgi:hypothetical protein